MLYVYFGNHPITVRQKAFSFIESLTEHVRPVHVERNSYSEGILTELAQGASLFGDYSVVILDSLGEEDAIFEAVIETAPLFKESANHFVLIEEKIRAPHKKILDQNAVRIEEIKHENEAGFNSFLLTDALLRRDKKSLWLLLTEAWRNGLSNEEIIGVLFWQIKTLRLAAHTKSAQESGLKPFVDQKARRALKLFSMEEVEKFSKTLIQIYHRGHEGKLDLSNSLETLILSI
jgi:hypothetical protein